MPMIYGTKPSEDEIAFHKTYLKRSLDLMERWLGDSGAYLCGKDMTIADLVAACELI